MVVGLFVSLAVAGPLVFYLWIRKSGSHGRISSQLTSRLAGHKGKRIAIVIPFIGEGPEAIPPYLEMFCTAAAGSAPLVDFLIIHSGLLDYYSGDPCPSNVKFISLLSIENLSRHLVRVLDRVDDESNALESKEKMARILSKHILKYPYVLVEFKPALGHIFSEFLEGYSHWGYSDLDILFGDLPRWITQDELEDFDIVTYGFGDQDKVYVRGQFTFHKNEKRVNEIWRECSYLSRMDQRFAKVLAGEDKLHFESAEGCYSAAILNQNDIRVKYAVKAFTDVQEKDSTYSHGLYVGTGVRRDRTVIYKAGSIELGHLLSGVSETWFETRNTIYSDVRKPIQWEVKERQLVPVVEKEDAKCMYWAQSKYQSKLCVDGLDHTQTVFWIEGKLYQQKHDTAKFPDGIVTAPFFHFQEWKRYYRHAQLASFHRRSKARTFVVTKEGVIPTFSTEFMHDKHFVPSFLGLELFRWHGVRGNDRSQLPDRPYCLISGPRKFPSKPPAPSCYFATSWQDTNVEIISGAPDWTRVDAVSEVTLGLTLQITPEQAADANVIKGMLDTITLYLDRWQGQPAVLVIHMAEATPEAMAMLRVRLGSSSDISFGLQMCLVAAIFTNEKDSVSRKALLNMVNDAAPTRWVLSGFELERGIVISHDTAFFAHRASRLYEDLPGNVFVVPQFGFVEDESQFTVSTLTKARDSNGLQGLSKFETATCDGGEDSDTGFDGGRIFEPMVALWWQLTEALITGEHTEMTDQILTERALALDDVQLSLVGLLTEAQHYHLFAMDISPILLVDNMGPTNGMLTSELARETDEFGGKQCYNGLRLSQLATLGYSINVLSGAFAASSANTRKRAYAGIVKASPPGASRCDGCFFFDEEHEDILEDISKDERERPAKAALLWDQSKQKRPLLEHS